jgi:hypothetical protein
VDLVGCFLPQQVRYAADRRRIARFSEGCADPRRDNVRRERHPRVRVNAGKAILDRTGFVAREIDPNAVGPSDLPELSAKQIRVLVATLDAEQERKRIEESMIESTVVEEEGAEAVGDLLG